MIEKSLHKVNNWFYTADYKIKNWQFLTGNSLKIIACLSMVIDHFTKIVLFGAISTNLITKIELGEMPYESYNELRSFGLHLIGIGRIAFPLFCFLLVEGFCHTHDRKNYGRNLLIFALLSELPFDLGFFSTLSLQENTFPFYWDYQNVLFTLFLGFLTMVCLEKFSTISKQKRFVSFLLQIGSVLLFCLIAELIKSDYTSEGILIIAGLYIARNNRLYQIILFLLAYILTTGEQPNLFIMIACLGILLYNGKRGKIHLKYAFYAFYPLHILLLYLLNTYLLGK